MQALSNLTTKPRLHCLTSLKIAGTSSFRLASGQFLGRYGANLQNPDKESVCIYEAPDHHSFVQPDQSGAEALVVAHLCRKGRYRDLFSVGIKPHTFLALHIFINQYADKWPLASKSPEYWKSLSPLELKEDPDWRPLDKAIKSSGKPYKIGKMVCHASSYRMRERTFQMQVLKQSNGTMVLSINECIMFLKFFSDLFPEIIEWQDEIECKIYATRRLENLFGFPRRFERAITDSYIREAISWIPQSTVGCITHSAIRKFNASRDLSIKPAVNNKHDSFLAIVPDAIARETAKLMQNCMAIQLVGRDSVSFTMKSESQIGKNWASYDAKYNPYGMRES
jgi:hypothetical protein